MPKKKSIVFIPVHLYYKTEKQKKELIRDLAECDFESLSDEFWFEKKKCKLKDIKIDHIK